MQLHRRLHERENDLRSVVSNRPTLQRRWSAIFWIREAPWGGVRRSAAGGQEFAVQPLEGPGRAIVGAKPQHDAPAMFDRTPGALDEFLHHRLDALGAWRWLPAMASPVPAEVFLLAAKSIPPCVPTTAR